MENKFILTKEEEKKLYEPIAQYIGKIQEQLDDLRREGTDEVVFFQSKIDAIKRDKSLKGEERAKQLQLNRSELDRALKVEEKNQPLVDKLIKDGEAYLKEHYGQDYLRQVKQAVIAEKVQEIKDYAAILQKLQQEHKENLSKLQDAREIKDEKYVYKNRLFDAKLQHEKNLQNFKDRLHDAYTNKFHLLDLMRMSRFTVAQTLEQKWTNYCYNFNMKRFLLQNGLYLAILLVFIALSIVTPIVKNTQLLTFNNVLNIFQQASPRMFLALGVAGLILLTGTDLSIGRMVGMCMTAATIVMHKGINTGKVFGYIFDFTSMPLAARVILALVVCVVLCTVFTAIAGFFTAKFQMHPFISTMANMLVIFGIVTYATKGVSFGAIESDIPKWIIPKINGFPTIILWAVAAIIIVWFIWNKTIFGKNLYAVGGNPEAAAVSGISVFAVTMGAFVLAGILYGFGSWLECARMVGSGSAAYGQGWEMDAIAACVVGGVSFTGGVGKISGVVVGVVIFTALTYALTILGIDTNLQFVFSGIIIMTAVTLDCLKYIRKK